jgi:PAS domain S-box-containing protein
MKKITTYFIWLIIFLIFPCIVNADKPLTVRVGLYENVPKIFTDKDGYVTGFWPELLRPIAAKENWQIEWVSGTWSLGLERLKNGEINIMPDTGWTEPRSREYDFSQETVLVSWSRLYVPKGSEIKSILDLDGRTIAALKGSFNLDGPEGIKEIINKFHLTVTIKELESYEQVFKALHQGKIDAGVTNKDFGNMHEDDYAVERTSIIFQPAKMQFSFTKGSKLSPFLMERIDDNLKQFKADKNSIYYQTLEKYIGGKHGETFIEIIPKWAKIAMAGGSGIILFLGAVGIVSRIQVRRRTFELQKSEEKYRTFINNSPDLLYRTDMEGKIIFISPSVHKLSGYTREEVIGMKMAEEVYAFPDQREAFIRTLEKNGSVRNFEAQLKRKDGSIWWASTNAHFTKALNGNFICVEGVTRDITEKKLSEEALRKSEERYREYFEEDLSGTYITTPEGQLIACNKEYKRIFGFDTTQHALSIPISKLSKYPNERLDFLELIKTEKRVTNYEPKLQKINCEPVHVVENASGVFDKEGNLKHIRGFLLDVTEQRKLEAQLLQAQKMEAVGTLAGGIAHDFNNILSGIFGYSQLAKTNIDKPAKAMEHISKIVTGAQRAAALVQQILTFSRKSQYQKHPLHIHITLDEALQLLRSSLPATIEIKKEIHSKTMVLADPTKIHQVIMNLGTNAYHAMGETGGLITISLTDMKISKPKSLRDKVIPIGDYLKLKVSDNGHGMDEKTLEKAFDPYFTTKHIGKGTGLGLAIVMAIVDEHGGFLEVYSELNKGTNFYIYLPVITEKNKPHTLITKNTSSLKGNEKIMFVDDEESIRDVSKEILERYGYKITLCKNGIEACEEFEKTPHQFDLIITDMTMPGLTGDKLAAKILKIRPDFPIILCTGYSENLSEADAMKIGIKKYIQKPIANQDLIGLIREVLDTD